MNAPIQHPGATAENDPSTVIADGRRFVSGNTAVTDDGLVVKNVAKIEQINVRMESRITARFLSWQVSREVRRDFLLLSSKMYKRAANKTFRRQVADLMSELAMQCELLKDETKGFETPVDMPQMEVPLRIVSAEAGLLFRIFNEADLPIATLTYASVSGVITRERQDELISPFLQAYKDLKVYIIGQQQSEKTAAELGREGGVA